MQELFPSEIIVVSHEDSVSQFSEASSSRFETGIETSLMAAATTHAGKRIPVASTICACVRHILRACSKNQDVRLPDCTREHQIYKSAMTYSDYCTTCMLASQRLSGSESMTKNSEWCPTRRGADTVMQHRSTGGTLRSLAHILEVAG